MNEKYIQAAILGSLIGGAILLDDFIKPDKHTNKKHMIIKSDIVDTEFKSIDDLKDLDVLKGIDVLEELDFENLEDMDVQVKIIKKEVKNHED